MLFRDRHDAGRRLAGRLQRFAAEQPVVIGLARGGVPVAFEVARTLGAPLDVLAARKVGAPGHPEFAVGALAEEGVGVFDEDVAERLHMTRDQLDLTIEWESAELERRVRAYRGAQAPVPVAGRTSIIVDDGLATGLSALAAVRAERRRHAGRVIVAAPVGSSEAVARLEQEADEVICVLVPECLDSVGSWYDDFSEVTDLEVEALLATTTERATVAAHTLTFDVGGRRLTGDLVVPAGARGLVLVAPGSGSSRLSARNVAVAAELNREGLATLLVDLLDAEEAANQALATDIPLLASRLEAVTRWTRADEKLAALPVGYFGASTGAAVALRAAAGLGDVVSAVVSRGGRADLAEHRIAFVTAPTLLIVGGADTAVLELNRAAAEHLHAPHVVRVVPGASHRFEEPGAIEAAARMAGDWFGVHLTAAARPTAAAG